MLSTELTEHIEGTAGTIAATLHRAANELASIAGEDSRIEAEVLMRHVLGIDRAHLLAAMADSLSDVQSVTFDALMARRIAREPLRYIVGTCEFYGVQITCTPAALIPRPETEMLVEFAIEEASRRDGIVRFADAGTGSGAIAVAMAANTQNVHVTATDVSPAALALAAQNLERNRVADRVTLVRTDLLDGLRRFDVIVANLPYVSETEWRTLEPEVRDHEPREALVGGKTGLEIIERLLGAAATHLAPGGALATEIGAAHGAAALTAARARFPHADVCIAQDFAGLDRVLVVRT